LTVKIGYTGGQANLHKVNVELPKALPTQLKTLNKACTEAQFNSNPGRAVRRASDVAQVTVHTPLLDSPLLGPAYLVSHGGAAFPGRRDDAPGRRRRAGRRRQKRRSRRASPTRTSKRSRTRRSAPSNSKSPQGELALFTAHGNLCDQKLVMPNVDDGSERGCPDSEHRSGSRRLQQFPVRRLLQSEEADADPLRIRARRRQVSSSGKGVSSGSKTYSGREALIFTLKQRNAGKLKTKIKLTFTPSKGKKQTKTIKARFYTLEASFIFTSGLAVAGPALEDWAGAVRLSWDSVRPA